MHGVMLKPCAGFYEFRKCFLIKLPDVNNIYLRETLKPNTSRLSFRSCFSNVDFPVPEGPANTRGRGPLIKLFTWVILMLRNVPDIQIKHKISFLKIHFKSCEHISFSLPAQFK